MSRATRHSLCQTSNIEASDQEQIAIVFSFRGERSRQNTFAGSGPPLAVGRDPVAQELRQDNKICGGSSGGS
jgi:hypothetical protein